MSQMACGGTDVGANSVLHQSIWVVPEFRRQQPFDGWPNAVNNRTQIPRLVLRGALEFFQRRQNRPAPRVTQNHHEPSAEPLRSKLDAADLRWSGDVSRNADDKQAAQTLVEIDLYWDSRVGTPENSRERLMACRQLAAARPATFSANPWISVSRVKVMPAIQALQAYRVPSPRVTSVVGLNFETPSHRSSHRCQSEVNANTSATGASISMLASILFIAILFPRLLRYRILAEATRRDFHDVKKGPGDIPRMTSDRPNRSPQRLVAHPSVDFRRRNLPVPQPAGDGQAPAGPVERPRSSGRAGDAKPSVSGLSRQVLTT